MGKGGAILGLLGILLGAGGLGFAFIIWNGQNNLQSQIVGLEPSEIWYCYNNDIFDVDTTGYLAIPNISLSIDLTTQASVHLLFTCAATTYGSPLGRSDLMFYYYIDEIIISTPNSRVGTFYGNNTIYFYSVALQYFIDGWSAGSHNISMFVSSTVTTHSIQYCTLAVQSFQV